MSERDYEALLRHSIEEIRALKTQLRDASGRRTEPIAVIGAGCRFPGGGDDPESFWRGLMNGVDAVREVSADRWRVDAYYDPDVDARGKMYTRSGAFLEHIDGFDADFFGISPREASSMSPQQRVALEVSWESLEHANLVPEALFGSSTGVYVGACGFPDGTWSPGRAVEHGRLDAYRVTGSMLSVIAGRISYALGLAGPSMVVDTSCSASLTALHLACQALRARECDLALAGGVNAIVLPAVTIGLSRTQALAPDGRCKTFDAAADGFGRGEGCAMVVLKRLPDAQADGNHILFVVNASALNQDGASGGLTAPSGPSQAALIGRVVRDAGVQATDIGYLEAHGTGTSLGDPIEIGALAPILTGRTPERPLRIGSVKTNIGHLEAAAGVAGFLKAGLALANEWIPPNLNFTEPNPHIPWDELPIEVPTEPVPWPRTGSPRHAGVSSFGMSGTNAHVVLGEAPEALEEVPARPRPAHLLTLSAASPKALEAQAARFAACLQRDRGLAIGDACHSAATARTHFEHRLCVVAEDAAGIREGLTEWSAGGTPPGVSRGRARAGGTHRLAFLFSGQGSQYPGMGQALYHSQPVFRRALDACAEIVDPLLELPLLAVIHPRRSDDTPIDQTGFTQPALFALEYALAELWQSWGLRPDVVIGHSVGEYVGACVAGVFDLEAGLRLVTARGRLMQGLEPGGAMAAIFSEPEPVHEACGRHGDGAEIAALNSPRHVVVSGDREAVAAVCADLAERGAEHRTLNVSHAFHSARTEPMLDAYREVVASVTLSPPRTALISNLTGEPAGDEVTGADYWVRHVREPVRFAQGIASADALLTDGTSQGARDVYYLEVGPQPTLSALARECLQSSATDGHRIERHWASSLRRGRADWGELLEAVATLHASGATVDWAAVDEGFHHRRVAIPTYAFDQRTFALDPDTPPRARAEDGRAPLYRVEWEARPAGPAAPGAAEVRHWLIVADRLGIAEEVAKQLRVAGQSSTVVRPGDGGSQSGAAPAPDAALAAAFEVARTETTELRVVDVASVDATGLPDGGDELEDVLSVVCRGALARFQAVLRAREVGDRARIWLVTRGAQPVAGSTEPTSPVAAALWGLARTAAREHAGALAGLVDLDPDASPARVARDLVAELCAAEEGEEVAYRAGVRRVARLVEAGRPDTAAPGWSCRGDGTYLVTGGLGGIGLEVAGWLVRRGARSVVLMSRGAPSEETSSRLSRIESTGARIQVQRGDVSSFDRLQEILAAIDRQGPPLAGVVHAAGTLDDAVLERQTWSGWLSVLRAKVLGAANLHRLTEDRTLDLFVMFSSAAAVLGSRGQSSYAAANAFLDALAHHRRARGLPAVAIGWGPWLEVGMAFRTSTLARMADYGLAGLPTSIALRALGEALDVDAAHCVALEADWDRYAEHFREPQRLLERLTPVSAAPDAEVPRARESFADRLAGARGDAREELLRSLVSAESARVLGRSMDESLDPGVSLFDMGLDSLMNVELRARLEEALSTTLPATVVSEHPTAGALSNYLLSIVGADSEDA